MRLIKIFQSLMLAGVFLLLPLNVNARSFGDVPRTHRYYAAIDNFSDLGIVSGYYDGLFRPDKTISRAEAVKLLIAEQASHQEINTVIAEYRANNYYYAVFPDVAIGAWSAPYVALAYQKGVVQGYPDGLFRPDNSVNFAEGLKLALEAYGVDTRRVRFQEKKLLYVKENDWFARYFGYAHNKNLINRNKFYHPAQPMTRGEFVDILYRLKTVQEEGFEQYVVSRQPFSGEYTITIPRLNLINIHVSFADPYNSKGALAVLKDGLGHYLSPPGDGRKMVLFGHSSGYSWDTSQFKQVLRQIDRLRNGDRIYINYQEKGYVYAIRRHEIIPYQNLKNVMVDYGNEEIAMYTCWPPDRISHRYVVYASPI